MMSLRNAEAKVGTVREVDGAAIVVRAVTLEVDFHGEEHVVEVGAYLNCGGRHGDTICMVSRIQLEELERKGEIEEVKKITLTVIGSIIEGSFHRGAVRLPTIGCSTFLLSAEQLKLIYGVNENSENRYFLVSQKGAEEAYLSLNKLLSRHVAILGTTGSGKSCTVASIVQSILETYPCPRMVFFDLHNEYANAFGHGKDSSEAFKGKTSYTTWDKFSLPYWYLDLDEFLDIYYPGAGTNQVADIKKLLTELKRNSVDTDAQTKERISCDSPVYFEIDELLQRIRDHRKSATQATTRDHWQKLELKLESVNSDSRYDFLKKDNDSKLSLAAYFNKLFGIEGWTGKYLNILDLSGLPSEVRNVCIGVLSRLCFDYKYWDLDPEDLPIALILEEAHTYIPEENSARFSLCRERIERIAKEGRKYGLGLIVVSQRPSNISTTVLSQCGTFVTLRLTNDLDQNKVKRFLPDTLAGQVDMLPSLRDGEALVSGDGISLPKKVRFRIPVPPPRSNDVRYHKSWARGLPDDYTTERVIRGWKIREKKK